MGHSPCEDKDTHLTSLPRWILRVSRVLGAAHAAIPPRVPGVMLATLICVSPVLPGNPETAALTHTPALHVHPRRIFERYPAGDGSPDGECVVTTSRQS